MDPTPLGSTGAMSSAQEKEEKKEEEGDRPRATVGRADEKKDRDEK